MNGSSEDHLVESTAAHDKKDSETKLKRVQSEFRIAAGNSFLETPCLADSHVSAMSVYCAMPTCPPILICLANIPRSADFVTLEVEKRSKHRRNSAGSAQNVAFGHDFVL